MADAVMHTEIGLSPVNDKGVHQVESAEGPGKALPVAPAVVSPPASSKPGQENGVEAPLDGQAPALTDANGMPAGEALASRPPDAVRSPGSGKPAETGFVPILDETSLPSKPTVVAQVPPAAASEDTPSLRESVETAMPDGLLPLTENKPSSSGGHVSKQWPKSGEKRKAHRRASVTGEDEEATPPAAAASTKKNEDEQAEKKTRTTNGSQGRPGSRIGKKGKKAMPTPVGQTARKTRSQGPVEA